jgi:Mor family transcriptional regulator
MKYLGEGWYPVRVTGLHNLEDAISIILARLYAGFLLPDSPITKKHVPKAERNADIIARYEAGEGISELARAFGLSPQRVFQLVHR